MRAVELLEQGVIPAEIARGRGLRNLSSPVSGSVPPRPLPTYRDSLGAPMVPW